MGIDKLFSRETSSLSVQTDRTASESQLPGSTAQLLTASCAPVRKGEVAPRHCLPARKAMMTRMRQVVSTGTQVRDQFDLVTV